MKKTIIFALTLLMIGCQQHRAVSPRLAELDSLIAVAPDSAAALLAAYPDDSLRTDDDRAYHALLLTQAQYKAYIPATSDSLINQAVAHYADGHDTDKRTRSLLYKGCVFEELPRLDSAMYYYKAAEDHAARSGDTYHRGYALMRMASLFQSQYAVNEAIACFRQSLQLMQTIHNDYDALYEMQELGNLYLTIDLDSAVYFTNESIKLSLQLDSCDYSYSLTTLAACQMLRHDYVQCAGTARRAIGAAVERTSAFRSCHWAAQAYALLGKKDSSKYFLDMAPIPTNKSDSVMLLKTKGILGDSTSYWKYAGDIADTLVCTDNILALTKARSDYNSNSKMALVSRQKRHQSLWLGLCALIMISGCVFILWHKNLQVKGLDAAVEESALTIGRLNVDLGQKAEEIVHCRYEIKLLQQELLEKESVVIALKDEIDGMTNIIEQHETTIKDQIHLLNISSTEDVIQLKSNLKREQETISEQRKEIKKQQDAVLEILEQLKRRTMLFYKTGWKREKGNLENLHRYMKDLFTDSYCNILITATSALYPRFEGIVLDGNLNKKELVVLCFHLGGFENKIAREFMQIDRDHSVTTFKEILAKKLYGEKGKLDKIKEPV